MADGPIGRDRHKVPLHEAARTVLGKGEAFLDLQPFERRECLEDFPLPVLMEVLEDIDCVIDIELRHGGRDVLHAEVLDHIVEQGIAKVRQHLGRHKTADYVNEDPAFVRLELLQQIRDIRGVKRLDQCPDIIDITGVDRLDHRLNVLRRQTERILQRRLRFEDPGWRVGHGVTAPRAQTASRGGRLGWV